MNVAAGKRPPIEFVKPTGVTTARIDPVTGAAGPFLATVRRGTRTSGRLARTVKGRRTLAIAEAARTHGELGALGLDNQRLVVNGVPVLGQLAATLVDAGFLVVRYDRRGVGQSGGRAETATIGVLL